MPAAADSGSVGAQQQERTLRQHYAAAAACGFMFTTAGGALDCRGGRWHNPAASGAAGASRDGHRGDRQAGEEPAPPRTCTAERSTLLQHATAADMHRCLHPAAFRLLHAACVCLNACRRSLAATASSSASSLTLCVPWQRRRRACASRSRRGCRALSSTQSQTAAAWPARSSSCRVIQVRAGLGLALECNAAAQCAGQGSHAGGGGATAAACSRASRVLPAAAVAMVEPDYKVRVFSKKPDDPNYALQWHHATISSEGAWDYTTGSSDVKVGASLQSACLQPACCMFYAHMLACSRRVCACSRRVNMQQRSSSLMCAYHADAGVPRGQRGPGGPPRPRV